MSTTAAGIQFNTVSNPTSVVGGTGPLAPLGFVLERPTANGGIQEWVYVEAGAAGINPGCAVMRDAASLTYKGVPTTIAVDPVLPARILGVAQHAIGNGQFGFILKRGLGIVQAGNAAAVVANTGLTTAGTGVAGTFAASISDASAVTDTENKIIAWCVVGAPSGPAPAGQGTAMIDCKG